jgi:hypothetical protein
MREVVLRVWLDGTYVIRKHSGLFSASEIGGLGQEYVVDDGPDAMESMRSSLVGRGTICNEICLVSHIRPVLVHFVSLLDMDLSYPSYWWYRHSLRGSNSTEAPL